LFCFALALFCFCCVLIVSLCSLCFALRVGCVMLWFCVFLSLFPLMVYYVYVLFVSFYGVANCDGERNVEYAISQTLSNTKQTVHKHNKTIHETKDKQPLVGISFPSPCVALHCLFAFIQIHFMCLLCFAVICFSVSASFCFHVWFCYAYILFVSF